MPLRIESVLSIASIPAAHWNALVGENPALAHAYLLAMEESGCVSPETGWYSRFLAVYEGKLLVGALPLYLKTHSYGEFVFDQAWAEAYEAHGLQYYPKLVSCVPFTPLGGARLLASSPEVRALLAQAALQFARQAGASSFHCLFPPEAQARELAGLGLMLRQSIQFHWQNAEYGSFSDFLASMRHDKRKKILQERRKLREAGVTFMQIRGEQLTEADWRFFYACYLETHRLYRSPVPLTLEFFLQIGRTMPQHILLLFAAQNGERVAAAFDLFDSTRFYGRSWGALAYIPGLHFELCYYQAIEFCIANQIATFEGGAQGEHKLARGFLPVAMWSAHWLAHPEFAQAVDDFLQRETGSLVQYVEELNESSPFKRGERLLCKD